LGKQEPVDKTSATAKMASHDVITAENAEKSNIVCLERALPFQEQISTPI